MKMWYVGMLMLVGCTNPKPLDMNQVAKDYYNQPRLMPAFKVTNVDEWTMKGKGMTVEMNQPYQPLNIVPRDPTWMESVLPTIGSVATFGIGAWAASQAFDAISAQPRVVEQPAPMIVRPEVITVPAP